MGTCCSCNSKPKPKPTPHPKAETRERFNSADSIPKAPVEGSLEAPSHPMASYVFPRSSTLKIVRD